MEEAFAEPSWSETLPLTSSDIRSRIRDQCGVYRLRAFTPSGEPLQIARCNGVDAQGILHIGESQRLQTRVLFFFAGRHQWQGCPQCGMRILRVRLWKAFLPKL